MFEELNQQDVVDILTGKEKNRKWINSTFLLHKVINRKVLIIEDYIFQNITHDVGEREAPEWLTHSYFGMTEDSFEDIRENFLKHARGKY